MTVIGSLLSLTSLLLVTQRVYGATQVCGAGTFTAGSSNPTRAAITSGPDVNRAFTFMVESANYHFTCCGVVTQWQVNVGKIGTIQFHVWRRKSTNVYELIGENHFNVAATGSNTLTVGAASRIVVQKGDFIGWHMQGEDMLLYESKDFTDSTLDNLFRRINAGDLLPGDTYDWSTVEAYNDREYGIQVTYIASTAPIITLASASLTVSDYLVQGTPVTSFLYSDADTSENSSLSIYERRKSAYFSTDLPNGNIIVSTSLRPRTDSLTYAVYDLCFNVATTTQSLTVSQGTLVIDNLDADLTVQEINTNQTLLHTLTVTDYSDQWYCHSIWATTLPFMLKALSNVSYGLYHVERTKISASTNTLTVTCVANTATGTETVSKAYTVVVTQNNSPRIDNLDVAVSVNAKTSVIGDTVYSVNATDAEGEVVEFSAQSCTGIQSAGAACPFTVMKNGDIQVNTHLITDANDQYEIIIVATDEDTNTDTGTAVVSLEESDDAIVFQNFPASTIEILENQPLGTSIYTFEYEDLDNDTKTFVLYLTPTVSKLTRHLTLDPSSGLLSTAFTVIDFEEVGGPTFTATVIVGDIQSTSQQSVQITIVDVNEAPKFSQESYHIEFDEQASGTQITDGASLFNVVEVDAGDTLKYYLDCTNASDTQRFYMTEATGAIVYQGDMDLDDTTTPTDYECTVTVVDSGGLNDTTLLYIHVLNVNERSPEFTSPSYTVNLPVNILVGTPVLTVSALDLDSSADNDNEITYTLDQSMLTGGFTYFGISHLGIIYTAKEMTAFTSGETFEIKSSNYGVASRTGTATVTVNIITTTTAAPTTTTDRNTGFYENEWNYYWLLLTLAGAFCMLLAVALVLFHICRLTRIYPWCYYFCMGCPCCRPAPPRKKGFGDKGYDKASFGHRHVYTDEDEEIDGWLKNTRRTGQNYKKEMAASSGGPAPVILDSESRMSSAAAGLYEDGNMPLQELRRLNTGAVPKAASYRDPIQKKSVKSKWKGTHRNKGSILKNSPSSWNR